MLGIQFWGLHRPDRSEPPDSISRSAPLALAVPGAALSVTVLLAIVPQPAQSLFQALVLALAGAMILLRHRDAKSVSMVPVPSGSHVSGDRWQNGVVTFASATAPPRAERLTFSQFGSADVSSSLTAEPVPSYLVLKRAFDLLASVLVALVVVPLFPLIALAIRIDSPGTVFYTQDRVGQGGRIFRIYKFRTMRTDAERNGAVWAMEGDPRVTRTGAFMRRSRIDELPQLVNVLRGEMTFVGPRPERPEFTSLLERELPGYNQRQLAKPGLTGWAQIRYQYASSIQDTETKLEFDLYYVRHRSLRFDARILVQTIPVVFHLQGR